MGKSFKALNKNELKEIVKSLEKLLTGYNPLSDKGAFKNLDDYELIGEEFANANAIFFDRLIKLSHQKHTEGFYVVGYKVSEVNPDLELNEGYFISNETSYEEYYDLGNKVMYGINGTTFLYTDKTFSWCIMTFVDVQLLFGDKEFMNTYFENDEDKKEVIDNFIEFLSDSNRKKSFKRLSKFIKYKINGNWIRQAEVM